MPIGEADRLITVYTPYIGKLKTVARGVRKSTSKISGHLEPLTYLTIMVAKGRTLDIISQVETLDSFPALRKDLKLISQAIYMADLIDNFASENESNPDMFQIFLEMLGYLQIGEGEILLRFFEMKLLENQGYLPELYNCVSCKNPLAPETNLFNHSYGGIMCRSCFKDGASEKHPISVNSIKVLRHIHNNSYQNTRGIKLSKQLSDELSKLLSFYIRHVLERKLKSTEFMNKVARM